ncbi:hypothetical protein PENTCL1PPCAC_25973 [Pristionchus entomophagus]|uniref:Uncharacterized protein n=1 Tax=Pristionchus entomophagus TaxID=358040 RepID=A0AAV5UA98_9BILA|nr:hypothetical protein PENTCL1PPCAC_25973 [Pristionchus entomophagus]
MCYALTSELAIIQGPPGTGKTHIGVEIVMAILENRIKWRMTEPILIVTFSNQALDHFLDKIRVKIEERGLANADAPSIVRLGSRSEHEAIKLNCLLATVMREYEEELACESASERNKAKKTKQAWLMKLMRAVKMVQISRKSIMEYNRLRQIMSPDHDQQLRQYAYGLRDSSGNQLCMDEVLVSWLLAKTYERKRDLPPGSDDDDEEEGRSRAGGANERVVEKKPIGRKKEEGRETKKEKNERKRREKRHQWNEGEDSSDSEEEDEVSWPAMVSSEANDEEEIENLVEMLEKMNESCKKNQASLASEEKWRKTAEKYEMEQDWEVEKEYSAKNGGRILVDDVEIFSRTTKPGSVNNGGGRGKEKAVNVDPNIVKDIHEQKQYILQKEGMTRDEVAAVRDVRNLPKEQRWKLLVYWQNTLANCMRSSLDDYCRQHEMACEKYEVASDASRAAVLKRALVIGATTTGAAKRRALLSRIGPKVLVVEEAAEVLEAHLLASIVPSVQHAIFIGDHQQLRPSTAVHQLAKMANMEVSLFERLVKNGYPFHTLGLQHRMLAPLTEHVVKPFFYKMLRDALSIHEYPSVQGMATNLFFWAHNVAEDTVQDSMSKRNKVEAEMCRNLANYIIMQGQYTPKEITIIGMYGAQVQEIKRKMQDLGPVMGDVAVETVDSFQGKENRVMILSLVRSKSGNIGFLGTPNRITVALTRAQHGMYVIGNFEDIASHSAMWDDITRSLNNAHYIDYALPVVCQQHENHTAISVNMHFSERTPFGGCDQQCGYQMPCGHPCKIICHPPHQHERFCAEAPNLECREACIKRCQKCDAQCTKRCQEPCGTCHSIVTLDLDCGHNVKCECGARNLARCKEPCGVVLECGHSCQNKCSVECVSVDRCEKGVGYDHPVCKHSLVLPCNRVRHATTVLPCYEKCPERLVCGHKCPLNCGEVCPSNCETMVTFMAPCGHQLQKKCSEDARHVKCTALVDSLMPHCSHKIKMECYQSRNQNECRSMCKKPTSCDHECTLTCGQCFKKASVHECNARCTKSLPCGHPCQGLCGRPCLCLANCRVRCSHQRCGSMSKEKGGNLSFGRQCSQPCVQCFEACDNHCEHRSCSKKCFEVCDVQACSQPCQKMLRCGHACLGLCGETCPKLCGTCDRTRYMSLIAGMASDDEPVPRLIQMPDCEHVYAYKWMDKSVKEQLTAGCVVLKCPRCSGMIEDCKRYMKQTKRLWAEADSRKWEKKMNDEEMSRAELKNKYNEMKNRLYLQQDEVAKYHKTVSRNAGREREKFALETFRMLESLYSVVRPELMKMTDSRAEYYYWETVVRCHQSVCGLVLDYLVKWEMLRVDFVNDNQPNLKAVMEEAFERRRSRVYPMRDQFTAMVEVVKSSLRDRRVGQLVPAIRSAMIMNHLYYHMEHLNATMRSQVDERGELQDLTLAQAGTYKRVIRSIRSEPLADHPEQKLVDMMNKIHADVYGKLQLGGHSCKVFKVDLPDF